jgi:SAM-dependent methyltransferase
MATQMRTAQDIDLYINVVIEEGLFANKGRLKFHMDTLFEGIDFKNKKVLDIGGGSGIYCFYAASRGAKKAVCLEPESEGSSSGVTEKFHKLEQHLQRDNVELMPITLQALEPEGETFDVILLHNSINHLDEIACINLLRESRSKSIYQEIASKIYLLSNRGAKLIICDCSRFNFLPLLKIRNPFAPTIEWHKHQAPEVWADLFGEVGFVNPKIRWTSFDHLRNLGRVLTGNKLMAYFLRSHFCLTMEKL